MKRAFLFPGQGSQMVGMAKDFYDNFSAARDVFNEVDETLGEDLTKIIFEGPQDLLTVTENAQPAIMTASIAMLEVLKQETNLPIEKLCDFVAGHSLGEYTALCASGALTLRDTARLLKIRGKAFSEATKRNPGAMLVLGTSSAVAEEVVEKAVLDGEVLELTNDNTNDQCVLSGNSASIEKAMEIAAELGIRRIKKLAVSGAFHSKLMESAVSPLAEALEEVDIKEPRVQIMANYTAAVEKEDKIKNNLIEQITARVRWRETMLNLESLGVEQFVEIGAGRILSNMVKKTCQDAEVLTINTVADLNNFMGRL